MISVVTPTHNRSALLTRLYESLCAQVDGEPFEWIIVDDASTDDTEEVVHAWMEAGASTSAGAHADQGADVSQGADGRSGTTGTSAARFAISYIKLSHGGKHRAVNAAVAAARGEYLFIVDDDDYLTPEALHVVEETAATYPADERLCGYSFLRVNAAGEINGGEYAQDVSRASFVDARINAGILGDRAEVWVTRVLRAYPFPEFEGEAFYPEDGIWVCMSQDFDMYHLNRAIYVSDYLDGGLTNQGRAKKMAAPRGMMHRAAAYLESRECIGFKTILKMQVLWCVYGCVAGMSRAELKEELAQMKPEAHRGGLFACVYPAARLIARRWMGESGAAASEATDDAVSAAGVVMRAGEGCDEDGDEGCDEGCGIRVD